MKVILVTGGAGFIGSQYVRYVLAHDTAIQVVNLDKLTYAGSLDNLRDLPHPERHHFVQGDIGDSACLEAIFKRFAIDAIVHFAAESHVDRSIQNPGAFVETNVLGTYQLLEKARQHQCRFHHISTDEVFGTLSKDDPAFNEKTPYAPNSPYSATKAASDHLVRAYFHTYGLPITMSNCSNNYGPYQHTEKLIPTIIRACVKQEPIPVYGDGTNIRDWLYVEDHCEAIHDVLTKGKLGESYNIGGNNEVANIDLVRQICRLMDQRYPAHAPHERLISYVTDRPGHDWRYAIDNRKIVSELQWSPKTSVEEGLKKTIDFYG
jgi:dTDP-glucose 4,6-dehydratase